MGSVLGVLEICASHNNGFSIGLRLSTVESGLGRRQHGHNIQLRNVF